MSCAALRNPASAWSPQGVGNAEDRITWSPVARGRVGECEVRPAHEVGRLGLGDPPNRAQRRIAPCTRCWERPTRDVSAFVGVADLQVSVMTRRQCRGDARSDRCSSAASRARRKGCPMQLLENKALMPTNRVPMTVWTARVGPFTTKYPQSSPSATARTNGASRSASPARR